MPDQVLVAVDRCAIEMPVADRSGPEHGFGDLLGREPVGTERPEPKGRDLCPRIKPSLGDGLGIDPIGGDREGAIVFRLPLDHLDTPAFAWS